ncbi:dimethylaniline monooxygenase [Aspergillus sclerotioniger CBS 115572]|uniref:Dimethylaniline monooxygenase n=1 Tax=Aspergillus sclerotioniger CBS 115572 TaxID=1450535 RepID=A0A317WU05_9EURO|nr:dimethylaniline monooxygenase [Aspergillus sclerotioniger CBS 115572]PWY88762.1 dimethylaniline monooxygenase [Aspergillus sclerotioniger CBS 115572]
MHLKEQRVEVIVVGAGLGGLATAKTYLELAPQTDLLILEGRSAVGGVWAQNSYEDLRTNNLYGTYEFSDFPLDPRKYDVRPEAHIPGHVLKQYFSDFADHFDLRRRVRFNTHVHTIAKVDGYWKVQAQTIDERDETLYTCNKLIMCTGLSSTPNSISIPGQKDFGKPILNHTRLGIEGASLACDPAVKSVTVIGASKYGYDAVYMMASHGKRVEWINRKSGGGAVLMALPWVWFGRWRVKLEGLTTTRFVTWFSPCIWGSCDGFGWLRRLLHGTALGRWLVRSFWDKMTADVAEVNGYRKVDALKHLEPDEGLFWTGRVGILSYPQHIYDFVRSGQVTVSRKDISHLSEQGTVHFTDRTSLKTDALIAITGWDLAPTVTYEPRGLDISLGVPTRDMSDEQSFWDRFDRAADEEILTQFPALRHQPKAKVPFKPGVSPFRFYRGIAPPQLTAEGDHSIAFMKMINGPSNALLVEAQALWTYAYLNDKIPVDRPNVYYQTALTSRFGKHRYPCGFGSWYPETVFDAMPYVDMLLMDLGINRWRKASWIREAFEEYSIHDYRGINREWREVQQQKRNAAPLP